LRLRDLKAAIDYIKMIDWQLRNKEGVLIPIHMLHETIRNTYTVPKKQFFVWFSNTLMLLGQRTTPDGSAPLESSILLDLVPKKKRDEKDEEESSEISEKSSLSDHSEVQPSSIRSTTGSTIFSLVENEEDYVIDLEGSDKILATNLFEPLGLKMEKKNDHDFYLTMVWNLPLYVYTDMAVFIKSQLL